MHTLDTYAPILQVQTSLPPNCNTSPYKPARRYGRGGEYRDGDEEDYEWDELGEVRAERTPCCMDEVEDELHGEPEQRVWRGVVGECMFVVCCVHLAVVDGEGDVKRRTEVNVNMQ